MSTKRQIRANRRNAARSTGPVTDRGKSRSAGNARKHGLTTPPAQEAVTRWYRIIRNDIQAIPNPLSRNVVDRTGFALAEAEARLERVCQAEAKNQQKIHNYIDRRGKKDILEIAEGGIDNDPEALEFLLRREDPVWQEGIRILLRCHPNRPAALRQNARQFARYRREAEAQRRRALRDWITVLEGEQKSRNPVCVRSDWC